MKPSKLAILLGCAALAASAWAGDGVWVSRSGEAHELDGDHAVFFSDDGAVEFDLADLADGETRIIGSGVKQVSVTRNGDEATIFRAARGNESELSITCRLGSDNCKILTYDDDPEQVMIMIEKTRECVNGVGDCDDGVFGVDALDGAGSRVVIRKIHCDEAGKCDEFEDVSSAGAEGAARVLIETVDGERGGGDMVFIRRAGENGFNFRFGDGKTVALRCPEGDTTMVVDKDEADDVFLCPKHSQPLEKVDRLIERRIRVKGNEPHLH